MSDITVAAIILVIYMTILVVTSLVVEIRYRRQEREFEEYLNDKS